MRFRNFEWPIHIWHAARPSDLVLRSTHRDNSPDSFDFGAETVKSHGLESLLQ